MYVCVCVCVRVCVCVCAHVHLCAPQGQPVWWELVKNHRRGPESSVHIHVHDADRRQRHEVCVSIIYI